MACLHRPIKRRMAEVMGAETMKTLLREFRDGIAPVVDFIFPPRCPICSDAVLEQGGLCSECWSGLEIPGAHTCTVCEANLPDERKQSVCVTCAGAKHDHDAIICATRYNDVSRQLVLSLKHGRRIALAALMARLIAARLPKAIDHPVFVPVPLHRWRLWKRGFNQSALIARELASLRKEPLVVDALVRHRQTPSLGGMDRHQRHTVLAGSVGVSPRAIPKLAGRTVVLVDDVLTSGATSRECVRALKDAGAGAVWIACFARVSGGL